MAWEVMTTKRLMIWITFLAIFAMATQISIDTDAWWHLRTGEWIVENRTVPKVDSFSYTRLGEPWHPPYWIMQVQLYLIYDTFGPGGVNLWTAGLVTLAFFFVWKACSGGPFLKAFILILAAATSGLFWAARPYLLTFVLSGAFIWILEDYRWGRKNRLIWLPILMIIWVNGHGGFPVGFILWGIYITGLGVFWLMRRWRRKRDIVDQVQDDEWRKWGEIRDLASMLIIGILMVVGVGLNPHGVRMFVYPFQTVSIRTLLQFVQEWRSPNFHDLQTNPFIWMLLLGIGLAGVNRRRIQLTDLGLFFVLGYLGLHSARNVATFALVAPVYITRLMGDLPVEITRFIGHRTPEPRAEFMPRWQKVVNPIILALVVFVVVIRTYSVLPMNVNEAAFQKSLPVEAVSYVRESEPPGRIFNHYNWGGYLLWALPEYPVFIDGRTDLFRDEFVNLWLMISRGEEGWQNHLDLWGVNLILIPVDFPLVGLLEIEGWDRLYGDQVAVLYGR